MQNNAYEINVLIYTMSNDTRSMFYNFFLEILKDQYPKLIHIYLPYNELFECSGFTYDNITINLYSIKKTESINDDMPEQLLKEEIKKYFAIIIPFEIHFILLVYDDIIKKQITLLAEMYSNRFFLIFPMNSNDYNLISHPYKYFMNKAANIVPELLNLLENIKGNIDNYKQYSHYSQEKYYNRFSSYDIRRKELNRMPLSDQVALFNSFEKFSFDKENCADDVIILIQLFTEAKLHIKSIVNTKQCNNCLTKEIICNYSPKDNKFLCENCTENPSLQNGLKQCNNCKTVYQKNELEKYIVTFCCNVCYCAKCLKEHITSNTCKALQEHNIESITCFCNNPIDEYVLRLIIGDSKFDMNFKYD